ncbi:MAG: enoyl-CoA hydratase-related protein [Albidovulum sp.]|nr:enoyl-CoA hydratase-related protein [Albidovulum sp.]
MNAPSYDHIRVEKIGSATRIEINRPSRSNSLHSEAHFELDRAFSEFNSDATQRVAVIRGAGSRAFCAGTDLKDLALRGERPLPATGFAGLTERFDLFKPVIAAINGDAVGGGMEIVLACDLAIAVESARFGLPEPRVGLAASGGLHRIARSVPLKCAMDIALTGRLFGAVEALEFGLINRVVPAGALEAAVGELADQICLCAPLSIRATKEMITAGLEEASLEQAFARSYPEYQKMLSSSDTVEGVAAFAEKREANWTGR